MTTDTIHSGPPPSAMPAGSRRAAESGRRAIELLAVVACVACAGLAFWPVYGIAATVPAVVAGSVVPAGLAWVWSVWRRVSLWLVVPASAVGWLVVVSATVLRGEAVAHLLPGPAVVRTAAAGLRDTWLHLLTTILPVPGTPELLVGLSGLVWLAGTVTGELAARTRAGLVLLVPPVVVLTAGLVFAVGGTGSEIPVAAAFVPLAAVLLLVRRDGLSTARRDGGRRGGVGRYAVGVPIALVAALVGVVVGPRLPGVEGRAPLDVRRYVVPVSRPEQALDPLDQVSGWLATPNLTLFTVGRAAAQDTRIAVLDSFDGQTWRLSGRFVATGARVPVAVAPADPARVRQDITIGALTGVWLPAAEQPVDIAGTAVVADENTGTLLSPTGVYAGLRFQVTSEVPRYDAAALREAVPAKDAAARAALALPPGLPAVLRDDAQQAVAGATFPFQQATRLEAYLRGSAVSDPTAPPGHTYGHLAYFLAVSHRGTSEQFATAFAVMARSLGLPARVVVGFGPGVPVGGGRWAVRGADALVWPEVDFQGLGWVPFYPTPNAGKATGDTAPAGAGSTSQQRQALDHSLDALPMTTSGATPQHPKATTHHHATSTPLWTIAVLAPPWLAVAYLAAVLLVPYSRNRRRRRAASGHALVVGAWTQALERLRPLGLHRTTTLTTTEVAAFGTHHLGPDAGPHLDTLAWLVDAAAFAGQPLDQTAGHLAWHHSDALGPLVTQATGRARLLRHRLGPGRLRS